MSVRISRITVDVSVGDLNSLLTDFMPEGHLMITSMTPEGIFGQLRFLFWNVDFTAIPFSTSEKEMNIEITAHKLVTIPTAIVQRQLREAIKDAPPGIDVISQTLRVNVANFLRPFGVSLNVHELQTYDGFVRLTVSGIEVPGLLAKLGLKKAD